MEKLIIIQGGNTPIEIEFDESVASVPDISVTLCSGCNLFMSSTQIQKQWKKSQMKVSGSKVSCPMTQDESKEFRAGDAFVEVKLINGGQVVFFQRVDAYIEPRKDKEVSL